MSVISRAERNSQSPKETSWPEGCALAPLGARARTPSPLLVAHCSTMHCSFSRCSAPPPARQPPPALLVQPWTRRRSAHIFCWRHVGVALPPPKRFAAARTSAPTARPRTHTHILLPLRRRLLLDLDDFLKVRLGMRRLGSLHPRHLHDLDREPRVARTAATRNVPCDGPRSGSRSGSRSNRHTSATPWVELRRRLCCSPTSMLRTSCPMRRT